jgi:hypothetical protein
MKRVAGLLTALAVSLVTMFVVTAAPAQADESNLRERAHARIAVIMEEAVSSGVYSRAQSNYVMSALLPVSQDPRPLPAKVEERTIDNFWDRIAEAPGVSVAAARMRVSNGATLRFVTGDEADTVQRQIVSWLANPAFRAYIEGDISLIEFNGLRDDIERSVDRLMRQSGGSDGTVVPSPRRN